jgi:hypothetical protein
MGYALVCCLLLSIWSASVVADEKIKAPLLTGVTWTQMTPDQKAAYIWGAGDVVDLEQELMSIYPELQSENFSAKVVKGIGDVQINDIIAAVDRFYGSNPDKLDHSILRVIWDTMIKPNLKTGIAGRPLS